MDIHKANQSPNNITSYLQVGLQCSSKELLVKALLIALYWDVYYGGYIATINQVPVLYYNHDFYHKMGS